MERAGAAPQRSRCAAAARALILGALLVALGALLWLNRPRPPAEPAIAAGPLAGIQLEVAFPALTFQRPVQVAAAPGEPRQLYVVEQQGVIRRFEHREDTGESEVFLDISARVSRRGNEEGLLGLAFAPDYATSGRFYLYYSAEEVEGLFKGRSILARFRRGAEGLGDPASEEVLLEVDQPYRNHNGGGLLFGPDGFLYLGLGDGGWRGDPQENGQDRATLLGALLRLDVSGERGYAIPEDNPFRAQEGARAELYAYGLRNPWRFGFDRASGELWVGDVGQDSWEEVHLVRKGDNCGWRRFEGFALYDGETQAQDPVEPVFAYGRGEGISITGGTVYRGQRCPSLVGRYLCADFGTGALWALGREEGRPRLESDAQVTAAGWRADKLMASGPPIASFGEDTAGELYLCAFDGKIYRLAAKGAPK